MRCVTAQYAEQNFITLSINMNLVYGSLALHHKSSWIHHMMVPLYILILYSILEDTAGLSFRNLIY